MSLQTQLAHHRLAQKRASLQKQRGQVNTGDSRDLAPASRRDMRPLRPGQGWPRAQGTPHTSDFSFQPIAEDEPVVDRYVNTGLEYWSLLILSLEY